MNPNGRTMRQAIDEGTAYEIRFKGGGSYWPMACETPEEVMDCAAGIKAFQHHVGEEVEIIHIKGGSIGCFFVESLGHAVLREPGQNATPAIADGNPGAAPAV